METITLEHLDAYAQKLVASLPQRKGATVLALSGELGAGKTALAQAIGRALGVAEKIPSPTFLVMRSYKTTHSHFKKLVHIDAYRIEDERELSVIGFEKLLTEQGTLVALEWPERLRALPEGAVRVVLTDIGGETREVRIEGSLR